MRGTGPYDLHGQMRHSPVTLRRRFNNEPFPSDRQDRTGSEWNTERRRSVTYLLAQYFRQHEAD